MPLGYGGICERSLFLMGYENLLVNMAAEPAMCEELFDKILDYTIQYANGVVKQGFRVAHTSDDYGTQTVLPSGSPEDVMADVPVGNIRAMVETIREKRRTVLQAAPPGGAVHRGGSADAGSGTGECGVLRPAVKRFLQGLEPAAQPARVEAARDGVRKAILETWADRSEVFEGDITEEAVQTEGRRIPLRLYRSRGLSRSMVTVFCHGGGWMQCDLDTHDRMCRLLSTVLPSLVVSVGYRLAPEAKHPAGLMDCYAARCWTADNAEESAEIRPGSFWPATARGEPRRGDGHPGTRSGGPAVGGQLLLYPVTDVSSFERGSYRDYREGYMLTPEDMAWYRDLYVSDPTQVFDPLVSPLLCRNLSRLPAAHVVTAEFDILRDEGEQYAARLPDSGVPVTCTRYNGMIHGFFSMDGIIEEVESVCREVAERVRSLLPAGDRP